MASGKRELNKESVWDYPRPPAIEKFEGSIRIFFNGEKILEALEAYRILETSHPPTYYVPIDQFLPGSLLPSEKTSYCEFKGRASYYHIRAGEKEALNAAWYYEEPNSRYRELKGHVAVYAHLMEECLVNEEKVQAQDGSFYGGWITSNIEGPFKGGPGTWGW